MSDELGKYVDKSRRALADASGAMYRARFRIGGLGGGLNSCGPLRGLAVLLARCTFLLCFDKRPEQHRVPKSDHAWVSEDTWYLQARARAITVRF